MPITPQEALKRIIEHREISYDEMLHLMHLIMNGAISPLMIAAILTGLRVKQETIGEISAAAEIMRELCLTVDIVDAENMVDVVGTGGDGAHTFNISTCVSFVIAAAGAKVSKHGNRSVSSTSGSADVMEALGIKIQLSPEQVAKCITETGFGFLFAPNHHPAMKNVAAIRKEMGVRSIFNILGPLSNPAKAPNILMGVFQEDLVGIQSRVLQRLGAQHALVVYGTDGLDEISIAAPTLVGELKNGQVHEYTIQPQDFGLTPANLNNLQVNSVQESKEMIYQVLHKKPGPARDIVLLNAGAALYAANMAPSIQIGLSHAAHAIDSSAALQKLEDIVRFTQKIVCE